MMANMTRALASGRGEREGRRQNRVELIIGVGLRWSKRL
jgi:hypothetical protein